jgi:hypothetical protein
MITHQQTVEPGCLQPAGECEPGREISGRCLDAHRDVGHEATLPAVPVGGK